MSNYVITSDGELKHYGVLGMKWGVRKNRVSKSKLIKEARTRTAELQKQKQVMIEKRKKFYDAIDPDNDYDNRVRYWAKLKPAKQKQLDTIESTIRSLEHEIIASDKLGRQRTAGEKVVSALSATGVFTASIAAIGALGYAARRK